jgi:hypothetical protein
VLKADLSLANKLIFIPVMLETGVLGLIEKFVDQKSNSKEMQT